MNGKSSIAPTATVRRTIIPIFGLTLLGTLVWVGAIFLAPFLKSRSSDAAASFIYALFSPICHQIPGRCFYFHGFPLAVCGRCLGIYAGFLAGLAVYPFVRGFSRIALPPGRLFILLSLPIGVDFIGGFLGLWGSSIGVRFATGLLWGVILPYYFVTGVSELILWRSDRKGRVVPSSPQAAQTGLDISKRKNVE